VAVGREQFLQGGEQNSKSIYLWAYKSPILII